MTLQDDAPDYDEVDDDVASFLAHLTGEPLKGKEKVAEDTEREDTGSEDDDEAAEDTEREDAETSEESVKEGEEQPAEAADEVEIKVGDEVRKVKLDDLKALYGQTDEVSRKATEATARLDHLKAEAGRVDGAYKGLLERAQAKWQPYAELDYIRLGKELDTASWEQLRADAQAAYDDVAYLQQAAQAHAQATQATVSQAAMEEAKASLAELSGPPDKGGIEGFNKDLYGKIMEFAVQSGLNETAARSIVNPATIRMLNKARLYDESQKSAEVAKAKVTAAVKTATKVGKPAAKGSHGARDDKASDAMRRLRQSGSVDDAADAFVASFRSDDE